MKRKEDDLARLDGKAIPTWAKVLIFIVSFAIGVFLFGVLPWLIGGR